MEILAADPWWFVYARWAFYAWAVLVVALVVHLFTMTTHMGRISAAITALSQSLTGLAEHARAEDAREARRSKEER